MRYETAIREISQELDRAEQKYPPMKTLFDGCGILEEEYHELRHAIRNACNEAPPGNAEAVRKEAIHVATMAVRFMVDLCPDDPR